MNHRDLFEDLFVLELANNHWGRVDRGLEIIRQHSRIVRFNNVRAAIKLQFRDVDNFIHKDFRDRHDVRYIKKTLDTKMSKDDYATLVAAVKKASCIPMATPFDEASVDLCVELGIPIIKIASSDMNDWVLLEKIAATKRPNCRPLPYDRVDTLESRLQNRRINQERLESHERTASHQRQRYIRWHSTRRRY